MISIEESLWRGIALSRTKKNDTAVLLKVIPVDFFVPRSTSYSI
jgi:hypothetical protein